MAKPQLRAWMWVAVVLAAGLALRLYFVLATPRLSGDTLLYGDIAKNLIEHHVYGFTVTGAAPRPTLIRVPGYPLFLAACFKIFGVGRYRPVLYLQIVFDLVSCLLVGDLARRLFGRRSGLIALAAAALCPFTANFTGAALTETLTLLCIAAAFYGVERWSEKPGWNRWLWMVAAALAYAALLRPEQGLLAVATIPAMLWIAWRGLRSRGLVPVATAAICVLLPLVPWTLRNERTFHTFQPLAPRGANDPGESVPKGFQRWYRTWGVDYTSTENVYWNYDGDDINIADLPDRAFGSQEEYEQVAQMLGRYNADDRATPELDRSFNDLAEKRIEAAPVRYYVVLPLARLVNMLLRPRTELIGSGLEWWKFDVYGWQTVFAVLYAGLDLAYLVWAGAGLWKWRQRGFGGKAALVWSMVAYVVLRCALLLTLDNSEPRYTLEFFPLLCVWMAASLCEDGGLRG